MMVEIQNGNTNGTSDIANAKLMFTDQKRKGFWSHIFGRSSNNTDEKKDDQQLKRQRFMNSLMNIARQAVVKEVMHVAEDEAKKQVEAQWNDNNGSQPTDANTTTANVAPDASTAATTTTTSDDVLSAPTNWAKGVVDSAQQEVQNLQNVASSRRY